MTRDRFHDDRHRQLRGTLRVIGPSMTSIGLVFTVVGFVDFFRAFSYFEPPRYFWCLFVGLLLVGIGMSITIFAYMGSLVGYQVKEIARVAKDTFEYLARETGEAVKTAARHFREGAAHAKGLLCPNCYETNAGDAVYCKKCGSRLTSGKKCPSCGKENDSDACFCQSCGKRLP